MNLKPNYQKSNDCCSIGLCAQKYVRAALEIANISEQKIHHKSAAA